MEPGRHLHAALRNPRRKFSAREQAELVAEERRDLSDADRHLQRVREQLEIFKQRTAHLDGEIRKVRWIFGAGAALAAGLYGWLMYTLLAR